MAGATAPAVQACLDQRGRGGGVREGGGAGGLGGGHS